MSIALGADIVPGGPFRVIHDTDIAMWTASPRYIALDYDGGNDNNAGYSDVSAAAAGAVAKKTWEGVQAAVDSNGVAILPLNGNGRRVDIIVKARAAGATYRNQANTADADLDLSGYYGYARLSVRGTATNATAAATAFADDAADQIYQGGIAGTGTNAAGYRLTRATGAVVGVTNTSPLELEHDGTMTFVAGERIVIRGAVDEDLAGCYLNAPHGWVISAVIDGTHIRLTNGNADTFADASACGGTITRYKVVKADGSAAALPAEAGLRMLRLRGDNANTTAATRNQCVSIFAGSTDTLVFDDPGTIPAVNAATDFWYIEQAGAAWRTFLQNQSVNASVSGLRFTAGAGSVTGNQIGIIFSFCQSAATWSPSNCAAVTYRKQWANNAGTIRAVGGSVFVGSAFTTVQTVTASDVYFNSLTTLTQVPAYRFSDAIFGANLTINRSGNSAAAVDSNGLINLERVRFVATRIVTRNSSLAAVACQFEGAPALDLIELSGVNLTAVVGELYDLRSSVAGKSGIGILGAGNKLSYLGPTVYIRAGVSVGDSPEILVNNIWQLHARDVAFAGLVDFQGNQIICLTADAGRPQPTCGVQLYSSNGPGFVPFQIARVVADAPPAQAIDYVLADDAANCSGDLVVVQSRGEAAVVAAGDGLMWVISDDVPAALNDYIYLSPTNPGQATATVPPAAGTNQKLRLGHAQAWLTRTDGTILVMLDFRPEMVPALSDGLTP